MTLGKIKVKNFQSVEDGEVELGSFTVFTGPSSSGKSAFLRAVHALVRNDFTPSQVTSGKDFAEVSIELDGHTITAQRGKGKSTYILDGEKFTKAGRSVPDKVVEALSMNEISGIDATFATQFDRPFLIADTGSVASKVLGSLTNVSVLHKSLQEASRRAMGVNSKLKVKEVDLSNVVDQLGDYVTLEHTKKKFNEAAALDAEIDVLEKQASELSQLITKVESLLLNLQNNEDTTVDLDPLDELLADVSTKLDHILPLGRLMDSISANAASVPTWNFEEALSLNADDINVDIDRLRSLGSLVSRIEAAMASSVDQVKAQKDIETQTKKCQGQYDMLLEGFEFCPLCNSAINH